jgi:hypothetical protein
MATEKDGKFGYHQNDLKYLGDPQITWKFLVEFEPQLELLKRLKPTEQFIERGELLTSHARKIEMPKRSHTVLKHRFLSWETVLPSRPEWDHEVTLTLVERQFGPIMKFIRLWQEQFFNLINPKDLYNYNSTAHAKRNLTAHLKVTMFHTDGRRHSVSGYYMNAWPKSINGAELDMTSEGMVSYDVTFAYDYAKLASYDNHWSYSAKQ